MQITFAHKVHQHYKEKNFTILALSLDRPAWEDCLKEEQYQLTKYFMNNRNKMLTDLGLDI